MSVMYRSVQTYTLFRTFIVEESRYSEEAISL